MSNQSSESMASFPKLGEDNYSSWSKNMKAFLMQKKVWAIVKGTDVQPSPGDANLRDWLKDEQLAAGVIYLGLQEGQKSQIEDFLDDPKKMWMELESIHVQKRPSTRFNAYNSLLSILKLEDESLPALTSRIERAMQEVKNLRPATFSLADLDSDLVCMAMIRSLPAEYRSFVSSLILLPKFDFKTLREAFILEEDNRKASIAQDSIIAAANLTTTLSNRSKQSNTSSPSSTRVTCEFCQTYNHTQAQCRLYKQFQSQARTPAQEARSNRRPGRANNSSAAANNPAANPPATPFSEQASVANNDGDTQEYAGNASTLFFDASTPQFSHSLRWCADTGATS